MSLRRAVLSGAFRRQPTAGMELMRPTDYTCRRSFNIPAVMDPSKGSFPGSTVRPEDVPQALEEGKHVNTKTTREYIGAKRKGLGISVDHPEYIKGLALYAEGDWHKALNAFLACEEQPEYQNNPACLMMIGKTLVEIGKYGDALKMYRKCDTLHAGMAGLPDLIEEADWGVKLQAEITEIRNQEIAKIEESGVRQDLMGNSKEDLTQDLLDQLPLEPAQVAWLKSHLGETLQRVGVTYDLLKGRCVVAKEDIPAGTRLFRDSTVMFAPEFLSSRYDDPKWNRETGLLDVPGSENASLSDRGITHPLKGTPTECAHCRKKLHGIKNLSQCRSCGQVYCSRECMEEAEKNYHLLECSILSRDGARILRDRLLSKKELGGPGTTTGPQMLARWLTIVRTICTSLQQSKEWPNHRPWFGFLSYREGEHKKVTVVRDKTTPDGKTDVVPTGYGLLWLTMAMQVNEFLRGPKWKEQPDAKEFEKQIETEYDKVYDKVKANAQGPLHTIYPFFSLLNHSCLPNARIDTATDTLIITEDIKAGAEVTVSYTPANIPTELKFHWIRSRLGFRCHCLFCAGRFMEEVAKNEAQQNELGAEHLEKSMTTREEYLGDGTHMTDGRPTLKSRLDEELERERYWELKLGQYDPEYRLMLKETLEQQRKDSENLSITEIMEKAQNERRRLKNLQKIGLFNPKEGIEADMWREEQESLDIMQAMADQKVSGEMLEKIKKRNQPKDDMTL